MTSRSGARAIAALGLACLAGLTITAARAADIGPTGRTIQAASAGIGTLTDLFGPRGATASWSAKASHGRHARPKGGVTLH